MRSDAKRPRPLAPPALERGREPGRAGWRERWHRRHLNRYGYRLDADADLDAQCDTFWHRHEAYHREYHRRGGPSFAKRLLVAFVFAWLLSMIVAGLVLEAMFVWFPSAGIAHGLGEQAAWIAQHLRFDAAGRPVTLDEAPDTAWLHTAAPRDWKFRVLDARGATILASEPGAPALAPAGLAFDGARDRFDMVADGLPLHVVTQALAHDGHPYFIQAAISDRAAAVFRGSVVGPILQNAAGIAVIALALFGVGVHFMLRRVLRPLSEASAAASRIDPRNLETRLSAQTMPREMRPLIEAFNEALDRLEKGYRVQQEFLASAAHELKTPLALMRGQVELSESTERETLLHDIDVMARQVHQLLHLAEASEVGNYEFERVDAAVVAGEAVAFLQRLAQRAAVHLDLRAPDAMAPVRADRGALFVLVKNLAENAIQHSPRGAVVSLVLGGGGIVVRDEGDGIAPEHLGELFKRFWRGPARRDNGAGLGLSICFEIATAHGWRLTARNGNAGGAEFQVEFAPS